MQVHCHTAAGTSPAKATDILCEHLSATACISRVPDQNGVSHASYIVEVHHSGRELSISRNNVKVQKRKSLHTPLHIAKRTLVSYE